LYSKIPAGPEAASLAAWKAGLALVGDAAAGEFLQGTAVDRLAGTQGARRVYARVTAQEAWILLLDPGASPSVTWVAGWKEIRRKAIPGVLLVHARRAER
jgi:hypothetical protein